MSGNKEEGVVAEFQKGLVTLIGGVDEAGVGCLAGPLVAVCLILPVPMLITRISEVPLIKEWWPLAGVMDSKLTTESYRKQFQKELVNWIDHVGGGVGVGVAPVSMFNESGHRFAQDFATGEAVRKASEDSGHRPAFLVVDGDRGVNGYPGLQRIEPKADANYFPVAAASMLAKIIRDAEMMNLDRDYPQYGWAFSKGYPTRDHRDALLRYGLSPQHREKPCNTVLHKHKDPPRRGKGW